MMGKVVDDQHAALLAADLLTPLDATKGAKPIEQLLPLKADRSTHRINRQSILEIVPADQADFDPALGLASIARLKKVRP